MSLRPRSGRELVTAGKRDRKITIERYSVTHNALNEEVHTWAPLVTVWASWRPLSANEKIAAAEVGATATDAFVTSWSILLSSVDPKDRIIFDGRTYDIASAVDIGRREGREIRATARTDEGEEAAAP